jgi:hypothetical protein
METQTMQETSRLECGAQRSLFMLKESTRRYKDY